MQNQISIQRSPSTIKEQASALSRKLSLKSNDSHGSNDVNQGHQGIAGVLSSIQDDEQTDRGRTRGDSASSIVEAANNCSLSKSSSERSAKSTKSVRSLHALGSFPLGTLRVHSPSPTRALSADTYDCLKSGDVIVVRDIPVGSLIGYDTQSFDITQKGQVEGIKNIPPGTHFICTYWGIFFFLSCIASYIIFAADTTSILPKRSFSSNADSPIT